MSFFFYFISLFFSDSFIFDFEFFFLFLTTPYYVSSSFVGWFGTGIRNIDVVASMHDPLTASEFSELPKVDGISSQSWLYMKAEWRLSILKYREAKAETTAGRTSLQGVVEAKDDGSSPQSRSSSDASSISQYRLLDTFPMLNATNGRGSGNGKIQPKFLQFLWAQISKR